VKGPLVDASARIELDRVLGATVAIRLSVTAWHCHLKEEARMAHSPERMTDVPAVSGESSTASFGPDWDTEDAYWQSAYPERQYARADRSYEYYRAAYRYGAEAAIRWPGREWSDTEHRLRADWLGGEHGALPWEEVRDAIRDAWDRVRGRSDDDRTHIR
jgi:hypothetical protein